MIILGTNSIKDTGFDVANSLRFNAGSSDSLTKTFGTPTNNKIWTYSFWMKHCDNAGVLLNTGADTSYMYFRGSSANPVPFGFSIEQYVSSFQYRLIPNQVFRDHSAWQHIVIAFDTTQGTASNRVKIYKNGSQITSFNNEDYPSQNLDTQVNSAVAHKIGGHGSSGFYDGYLCEVVFIDGQQLAPDQFGEFDSDSGIWKPIDVSGLTFGNNGFYLDFENSGALGADVSGNSNNFTVNNLTAIDQSIDTCTNNFCTMNPLDTHNSPTITDGNTVCNAGGSDRAMRSTIGISNGKWYWEVNTTANNSANMGIINGQAVLTDGNSLQSVSTNSVIWEGNGGLLFKNGSSVTTAYSGGTATYGFAFDLDNGTLKLSKDGTFFNSGNAVVTGITADTYIPFFAPNGGGSPTEFKANFGSPAYAISSGNTDGNGYGNFEYAVPSGYYSLNTKNLAEFG